MTKSDAIAEILTRGVDEVIIKNDLEKILRSRKKLRIKFGIDPTSPHVHIGRGVVLLKLRDFQQLGHQVVFIVGDFTGEIGDTSDKESERPTLSTETVKRNMKTYLDQAGMLLDLSKIEVHYNSEWLEKPGYREICRQANAFSLAEIINREFIKKRLAEGKHISLREVLYPLMQGFDSVMVKSDIELGGTDQRFNMLAGRALQEAYGQKPQNIITMNLILGTDGRKMSSSWGNTINFTDAPDDMYGKVMSIPDDLIIPYFIHCTRTNFSAISEMEQGMRSDALNPRDCKMTLAREIVTLYHGAQNAQNAQGAFISTFQKKQTPQSMPELTIHQPHMPLIDLLIEAKLATSKNEARRLIIQRAVSINDVIIDDCAYTTIIPSGGIILKKGKRHFVKVFS